MNEPLVVSHLLDRLRRDENLLPRLFYPKCHQFAILSRTALVIGHLLRRRMQWIELRCARVIHARQFGSVSAQLDGDELPVFQAELLHRGESAHVIAHINAEAAIRTKLKRDSLDARILENLQRLRLTRVDERGSIE